MIRSLPALAGVITLEQISEALLPTIDELAADSTWRTRHQLVSLTPDLAKRFGMGFFQQQMIQRSLAWLVDRTAVIRSTAAGVICEVAREFGPEWTKAHLLDEVRLPPDPTPGHLTPHTSAPQRGSVGEAMRGPHAFQS